MKGNGSKSMSAHLTLKMAPSRGDDGPSQPQTATCCTALQRGFAADTTPSRHARFAPVRTPGSAALMLGAHAADDGAIEEETEEGEGQQQQQQHHPQKQKLAKTPTKKAAEATKTMIKKMVRKCKSSVADVDVARLGDGASDTPRLRRSGAIRRDWSFEDLRGGHNAA